MQAETYDISRREFLKHSTAAGLGMLLAPCLDGLSWAASKDRVTVLNSNMADSMNPYNHSSNPTYGLWQHITEPLVEVDFSQGKHYGVLAESWEFEGKRWVFHLRKGIRFHNGAPFTAKDVIFSVNRIKTDKQSLQASNFREVTEMQAPDDYTVIFVSNKPNAVFLDRVINRFMLSRVAYDKYGDKMDEHMAGTGPYKFVSFVRDGNFVMRRNDEYWGKKPEINEVVYRKVNEEAARVAGLEAGQADVINNVPVHEIPRLDRHPRVRIEKVEGLRTYFLALNPAHKPFDNKLVRQAVNYSVNAEAIVKNIFDGNGYVLNGPIGPNVIGYSPEIKRYPYEPKKAKELLAKAGYSGGLEVKLYYGAGRYPKDTETLQVVAEQMRAGGFRVELVPQEWVVFWGNTGVNGGKLPFYYIGRGGVIDADTLYDQYFRTGVTKRVLYSNPNFDKLIEQEQVTGDHNKRVAFLQEGGKILMEDVPLVPLFNLADVYGVARNVIWKARPDEKILANEMTIKS